MAEEWCLIESDPGVFTEMIKGFGALALRIVHIVSIHEAVDKGSRAETSCAHLVLFGPVHGPTSVVRMSASGMRNCVPGITISTVNSVLITFRYQYRGSYWQYCLYSNIIRILIFESV